MTLEACLPDALRGATITKIAAGMSGAGVYRVGDAHVLKVGAKNLALLRRAADAGVAPAVVHIDEARAAVVSELVVNQLAAYLTHPTTRDVTLDRIGNMLARVHAMAVPDGTPAADPRAMLGTLVAPGRPAFAAEVTDRVLAETPPDSDRALVLSHNDVNPSNLVHDGTRILLLDWDVAGPNDPLYDLATLSLFLRLGDAECMRLVAAHDGAPITALPTCFCYLRRLVGALAGNMMLVLAHRRGHVGGGEAMSLLDYYRKRAAGQVSPATPAGQWLFGLALLTETLARCN